MFIKNKFLQIKMAEKLLDVYGIIGLIISIVAIIFSLYISPKEIPLQYVFIVIIGIGLLGIIMILLNKFSKIDSQLLNLNGKIKDIGDINKRFKTLEELNDIRLDIRELKREIFK